MGHFSRRQFADLAKFGRRLVDSEQIDRTYRKRGRKMSMRRITLPVVPSWIARFSGGDVDIDVIYPFGDTGSIGVFRERRPIAPSSLGVDSLARSPRCALAKSTTAPDMTQAFMGDWAMHFESLGALPLITSGEGSPEWSGANWVAFPDGNTIAIRQMRRTRMA